MNPIPAADFGLSKSCQEVYFQIESLTFLIWSNLTGLESSQKAPKSFVISNEMINKWSNQSRLCIVLIPIPVGVCKSMLSFYQFRYVSSFRLKRKKFDFSTSEMYYCPINRLIRSLDMLLWNYLTRQSFFCGEQDFPLTSLHRDISARYLKGETSYK